MKLSNVSFAMFPKFDIQLHNKFHNFFSQLVEQVESGWCNTITFIETTLCIELITSIVVKFVVSFDLLFDKNSDYLCCQ